MSAQPEAFESITVSHEAAAAGIAFRDAEIERLREALIDVTEAGSALESAWLVPKIDRETQLSVPVAHLRAALAIVRATLTRSEP